MEFTQEDYKELHKYLTWSLYFKKQRVAAEDVIITFGGTRAGKSSLINFLIGNKLQGEKFSAWEPVQLSKVVSDSPGPEIGIGKILKTKYPEKWISEKLDGVAVWDHPGFNDHRCPIQDIKNALYLFQLLHKVKSLKIVLVVDINDILRDNIKPFISVLDACERLLGNKMEACFPSISIIFTKVPDSLEEVEVDKELIKNILCKFLSSTDNRMSDVSAAFIKFLIENNDHIALFKRAKLGPLTSDIDVDIFPAIKNLKKIEQETLKEVNLSISDSAKIFLFKAREYIFLNEPFTIIEQIIIEKCSNKASELKLLTDDVNGFEYKIKVSAERLKVIKTQLLRVVFEGTTLREKLNFLQELETEIIFIIVKHKLFEEIELMEHLDKLLEMNICRQMSVKLQRVILFSLSVMIDAIIYGQLKIQKLEEKFQDDFWIGRRERHLTEMSNLNQVLQKLVDENQIKQVKLESLGIAVD